MRTAIGVIFGVFALIAAVVGAAFALLFVLGRGEAQFARDRTKEDLDIVASALNHFERDCGCYPTTSEGLKALLREPPLLAFKWHGPCLDNIPDLDVWGRPYDYRSDTGEEFTFTSLGADGRPGGEGDGADLEVHG